MAVPMGLLSGGVAGVAVNSVFNGAAPEWVLALAVALATGAGSLANVFSMLWSHWSQGRAKVNVLTRLQAALGVCLAAMACAPLDAFGLALTLTAILTAQVLWCGIITVRASIWRVNYTRTARTAFAARNQVAVSACTSAVAAAAGFALDLDVAAYRWLFAGASGFAFVSMAMLKRIRVRRERQLMAAEQSVSEGRRFDPRLFLSILRDDRFYRSYMTWMMVFGSGNLMVTAVLILVLTNNLGVPSFTQVLVTTSVPMLLIPLTTPIWGRILARHHVVKFRTLNSRLFVASMLCYLSGATLGLMSLMWLGCMLQGAGIGGGQLGWNLGHNDFAPDERVAEYLGLHITLTGLRGLVAPLLGVGLYGLLEGWQSGAGVWALALPFVLTTSGSIGFHHLNRTELPRHD
jgi:MFS family permease